MDECFKCGVLGDKVRLYDAISKKGIVKICNECMSEEKLPIINKPIEGEIMESPRQQSVREKLVGMGKSNLIKKHEVTLRELIDKNFKARKNQPELDLIDNFHWIVQRKRRAQRIPRGQFAKNIGVTEETIKMIEQGILPENNYKIISKIEDFFGINLRKPSASEFQETKEDVPKKFSLDEETTRKLKISDLREMNKENEKDIFEEPIDSWEEEWNSDEDEFL